MSAKNRDECDLELDLYLLSIFILACCTKNPAYMQLYLLGVQPAAQVYIPFFVWLVYVVFAFDSTFMQLYMSRCSMCTDKKLALSRNSDC